MVKASDGGGHGPHGRSSSHLNPIRPALVVASWIVLAGLLIGVGVVVDHSGAVQNFDNHVTSFVVDHRTAGLDAVMKAVTWLGSWVAVIVTAAVLLFLVLRRRLSLGFLLLAVVAWAGTLGATTLAKRVVQRPRPPENLRLVSAHGWSWPSGHAATATLVFAVLATVAWMLTTSVPVRVLAVVCSAFVVLAVAFSRVEVGVHWTTDVLASLVFATAWLVVLRMLFGAVVAGGPSPSGERPAT
jgi:membrane-associated phospholipid phosphatase